MCTFFLFDDCSRLPVDWNAFSSFSTILLTLTVVERRKWHHCDFHPSISNKCLNYIEVSRWKSFTSTEKNSNSSEHYAEVDEWPQYMNLLDINILSLRAIFPLCNVLLLNNKCLSVEITLPHSVLYRPLSHGK